MKRATVMVATVVAVLVATASAGPAATGAKSDGLIAFLSTSSGSQQLYTVRPDATGLQQVTDDAVGVGRPRWSPDGKYLVVPTGCPTLGRDGQCSSPPTGIAIMRPDGSNRVDIAGATSPVFSPDANWLLFLRCGNTDLCDLHVAHASGRGERLVDTGVRTSSDTVRTLDWSSDSKKLVYLKGPFGAGSIWQSDRQGKASLILGGISDLHSAAFFPDDETVAYVASFGAHVFTIAIGESVPTRRTFGAIGDLGHLIASPTHTRLASQAFTAGPGGSIQVYNGDVDAQGRFVVEMSAFASAHTPVWSPDGARIAYTFCSKPSFSPGGPCSLRVIGSDNTPVTIWNGPATELTDWVRGYDWSPDSSQLVMSVAEPGAPFRLNVVNADGSGLGQLLPGSDNQYTPAWRP